MAFESRPRFGAILREKECWIPVVLAILYCFRALFLGETFFYRDIYRHSLPQKYLLVELLRSGQLPLWDPNLYGGQPFLANVNNVVLQPSNLLYLFLPIFTALNIVIAFHLALCGFAFYLLARVLGFRPVSSLAASAMFTFCGYTLSLIQFLGHLNAIPLLPLMLLIWHLYLTEGKKLWFVVAGVVGAIQVFSGAPEITLITLFLLLGWSLTYQFDESRLRTLKRWCLLCACVGALAAVQILPTFEMLRHSSRSLLTYDDFTTWSVHLKRFPELIFPHFLGRTDALSQESYWGKTIEGAPYTYILSIYFGIITIIFAVVGLLRNGHSDQLPLATKSFFACAIFVGILLAMGKYLPGFHFLYVYIPLIHWFRYPVKFLGISILPVILLATAGFEDVFLRRNITKRLLKTSITVSILLVAFAAGFYFSDHFAAVIQQFFFRDSSSEVREGLKNSFNATTFVWLGATLAIIAARIFPNAKWVLWSFVLLVILDLFLSGSNLNPTAPRALFSKTPQIALLIKSQIRDQRLFRDEVPQIYHLRAPTNEIVWQNLWDLQILNYYTAALYDIPLIFHKDLDAMAQRPEVDLKKTIDSLPWERRLPLLSAGSVSLVLTDQSIVVARLKLLARLHNASNLPFYLYRNEGAVERVSFITQAIFTRSHDQALKEMIRTGYDPEKMVVLETKENFAGTAPCAAAEIQKVDSHVNSSILHVENACDGFLVFSEPLYPGWHASIDGKKVPVLRANYAFSAIYLPAGKHVVKRQYQPLSVCIGALLSLTVICLMVVSLVLDLKRRLPETTS